jgi:hypothetical protein
MFKLNTAWAISFDDFCVTVHMINVNQKTGEEYTRPKFYFPNLETALDGIIDRSLDGSESLEDVVDRIKRLKAEIREFLKQTPPK